jgi:GrpB-like predicted nucleotidyltransferase (UPF0157 family)
MDDEVVLNGGPERRTIAIVSYDPSWTERFEQERSRILAALGTIARRIDHVGSTAVPGLAAKPIVDIDLSVDDPDDEPAYVPALERAGYQLRVRERGHRMLRTSDLDVHVHVCPAGGEWERRHLLFRDRLRVDATDRERSAAAKRQLARRDWPDMNAYADAKTMVIQEITADAEQWARATSWTQRTENQGVR